MFDRSSTNDPSKNTLRAHPSIQTYIAPPTLPPDSVINRVLQVTPLGTTRAQSQGTSLQNTIAPRVSYTGSRFDDFQFTATLGMDQGTLSARSQTADRALGTSNISGEPMTYPHYLESDYTANRIVYKKDSIESYDFCSELRDSDRPPYKLDCLKKEFLREGGQSQGRLFPREETLKVWNSYKSWLDVKSAILKLSTDTDSINKATQQNAILNFFGVRVEPKKAYVQEDPGLECFWFTHSNDLTTQSTFLGRRIRTTIPFVNRQLVGDDGKPIKRDKVSMIYFSNMTSDIDLDMYLRVTADDGFGTHYNSYMSGYVNMKRVNSHNELTSLTYMAPTTFTLKDPWYIKANGQNYLSGYYHQGIGGLYYKLEIWDGYTWALVPERMLSLQRNAFAPMVCFEVNKAPGKYGCDYPFCDKRFGGYKMKWTSKIGGGPNWDYCVVPNEHFPFGKSAMNFSPGGGGILSKFSFKLYAVMTMTMLIRINQIPQDTNDIMVLFSELGQIALRVTPKTRGSVELSLATKYGSTDFNPIVPLGQPILVVIRFLRNEHDIYSLDSIQIGAGILRGHQVKPEGMKESKPFVYSDPRLLENPDSANSYTIHLGGYTKFSLFWIYWYDYPLKLEKGNLVY